MSKIIKITDYIKASGTKITLGSLAAYDNIPATADLEDQDIPSWQNIKDVTGDGIAPGGTTGQILKKISDADFDTSWEDLSFANLIGSPGDNISLAAALALLLPKAGGVMTGDLQLPTMPVNATSAITKGYADNLFTGLSWKQEVRGGTTGNITLSGTQTIDGVALIAGDRVLVKNQTTQTQNGIYLVASGSWTRTVDADTSAEIGGAAVLIRTGTVNKNTQWTCTNSTDPVIGTDNITFGQISGAGTYTNGTGILLSANVFSLDTSYADTNYVRYSGATGNIVIPQPFGITAESFGTYDHGGGTVGISSNTITSTNNLAISAPGGVSLTAGNIIYLNTGIGQPIIISNGVAGVSAEVSANSTAFTNSGYTLTFGVPTLTADRNIGLPDASGTLALLTDIPAASSYIQNIDILQNLVSPVTPQTASIDLNGLFAISDGTVDIWTQYYATSGATISTRWNMAIAITTDPTVLGNHAYSDMTNVYKNINGTGHASYDARFIVTGSGNYDHTVAFQDGTSYQGTGTITDLYGAIFAPNVKGPVTNRKAIYIDNAGISGSGSIVNQYGIYINPLTSATNNYSLFAKGTAKMHHEGDIELFDTTGTIGGGRYLRFLTGSASPVASLQSVYQSTTWGDLVFNARFTTGTTDAATKEVFRVIGGALPGTLVTGSILFSNNLSSASQIFGPSAATSGGTSPFIFQANIGTNTDTDGGPSIQLIPAANGTGATNGGRINIGAYSAETGSSANSIRFFTRSGTNAATERMRIASDGGITIGTGANTTTAYLTISPSLTTRAAIHFTTGGVDPTSPTGGDFWYKTSGLFYYDGNTQQVAKLASPAFTGTPTAPTAAAGTNTTQLATCALVFAERANTLTLTNKTIGDKIRVTTGANASIGSATLVAGTVTVTTTAAVTGSIIFFTRSVAGGTVGTLSYTIITGTSFTINSSSVIDTSTIGYIIIN